MIAKAINILLPNSHLFPIRTLRSYIYNTIFLLQYNVFFPSLFALFQYQLASSIQGYKYKLPGCRQLYCLPIGMNIILIAHFFFRKDFKSSEDYLLNCTMQKPCGLVSPTSCPHLVLPSVSVQCNIISSADVLAAKHWLEEQVSKGSKWNQYLL